MLVENRHNLNKVDLESNSSQKFETGTWKSNRKPNIHKTDKIKCSNRYEIPWRDDKDDKSCNSYVSFTSSQSSTSSDEISDEISYEKNGKISTKRKETKGKDKNTVIKQEEGNSKCKETKEIQIICEKYWKNCAS